MEKNKCIIIGGDFGEIPKSSSIVKKLSELLQCDSLNGGTIDDLINVKLNDYDLILWFANISNNEEKNYPKKPKGSVLICSKLIHDDVTDIDAVSRIFKMNANAVISIRTNEKPFNFKLIDALGNVWCNTSDLNNLYDKIKDIYNFTNDSIRYKSISVSNDILDLSDYQQFIDLNKLVADKTESMGGRYFGNCSTRCDKMFPSIRFNNDSILVSRRNVDKNRLTVDDLVLVKLDYDIVQYNGKYKPSVDTPIQLQLYRIFPNINFMIHGHYYVDGVPFTEKYNLCGDVREVNSIFKFISISKLGDKSNGIINLKNHGFLIYASTLDNLDKLINNCNFIKRNIGFENIS